MRLPSPLAAYRRWRFRRLCRRFGTDSQTADAIFDLLGLASTYPLY